MKQKVILFFLGFLLLVPISVLAFETHANDIVIVGEDQVIDSNYYAAGQDIEIYGTVNGDLFLAGQNIVVDSDNINGDIFAAGSNVVIKGDIKGSVRIAGQRGAVEGVVEKNLMFFGQSLKVEKDSTVDGHTSFWGQILNVAGKVAGNVEGGAAKMFLSGEVGKNIDLYLSDQADIELTDDAKVDGRLFYKSFDQVDINPNAYIGGGVSFDKILRQHKGKDNNVAAGMFFGILMKLFAILIAGALLLYFWPKFLPNLQAKAKKSMGKMFLVGFVSLILAPVLFFIILITVIGIPIALLFLGVWLILLYIASVLGAWLMATVLQEQMFKKSKWSAPMILTIGALLYVVIGLIPFLGWLVVGIFYCIALGTLVQATFKRRTN